MRHGSWRSIIAIIIIVVMEAHGDLTWRGRRGNGRVALVIVIIVVVRFRTKNLLLSQRMQTSV